MRSSPISGWGGAIFNGLGNYSSSGYGALNGSAVSINWCFIALNQAESDGLGKSLGGGIANLLSATTSVAESSLILNEADGDGGAAGLGGGAYNDATSTLGLTSSLVILNRADGAPGIGGGIYNLGTFTFDAFTFIKGNHASTSNNNVFG